LSANRTRLSDTAFTATITLEPPLHDANAAIRSTNPESRRDLAARKCVLRPIQARPIADARSPLEI
jgi:hypothetical protein